MSIQGQHVRDYPAEVSRLENIIRELSSLLAEQPQESVEWDLSGPITLGMVDTLRTNVADGVTRTLRLVGKGTSGNRKMLSRILGIPRPGIQDTSAHPIIVTFLPSGRCLVSYETRMAVDTRQLFAIFHRQAEMEEMKTEVAW